MRMKVFVLLTSAGGGGEKKSLKVVISYIPVACQNGIYLWNLFDHEILRKLLLDGLLLYPNQCVYLYA